MTLLRKAAGICLWIAVVCLILSGCNRRHSTGRGGPPIGPSDPAPGAAFIPFNPGTAHPNYGPVAGGNTVTIVLPADFEAIPASTQVFFGDTGSGDYGNAATDVKVQDENPWFLTCTAPPSFTNEKGVVDLIIESIELENSSGTRDFRDTSLFPTTHTATLKKAYTYIDPLSEITFHARQSFSPGSVSNYVPTDYDGDGLVDLVGRHTDQEKLYFLKQQEGGGFFEPEVLDIPPLSRGSTYEGLLVGDLNHDDLDDLVAFGEAGFLVLEKTGVTPLSYDETVYDQMRGGTAGILKELNKDGYLDLVLADPDAVRIFYYDQNAGSFPETPFLTLEGTTDILDAAVADINGDHLDDIVTVGADRMLWFIADGENSFQMKLPIHFDPIAGPQGMVKLICADLNEDGAHDAIIASANYAGPGSPEHLGVLGVALADGIDGFELPEFKKLSTVDNGLCGATDLAVADLDHDGNTDVVLTLAGRNSIAVYRGDGNGALSADRFYGAGALPLDLALVDMNNDQILDFVAAEPEGGTFSLIEGVPGYSGMGRDEYLQCGVDYYLKSFPSRVEAADLDDDDYVDFVIMNDVQKEITILLNNGGDGFITKMVIPVSGGIPVSFCLFQANFKEDDYPDLAVIAARKSDLKGKVTLYLNDGDALFVESASNNKLVDPQEVRAGDLNNDGLQDIVVTQRKDDQNRFFYGDGKGAFESIASSSPLTAPEGLYLADLNNDHLVDGVSTAPSEKALYILPTTEDAPLDPGLDNASTIEVTAKPVGVAVADFDGDQFVDLAVSLQGQSECRFYRNNNFAGFDFVGTSDLSGASSRLLSADLDFDHAPDLFAAIPGLSGIDILSNAGDQLLRILDKPVPINGFSPNNKPVWIDLNNDLLPDLIVPSATEMKFTVLFNRSK